MEQQRHCSYFSIIVFLFNHQFLQRKPICKEPYVTNEERGWGPLGGKGIWVGSWCQPLTPCQTCSCWKSPVAPPRISVQEAQAQRGEGLLKVTQHVSHRATTPPQVLGQGLPCLTPLRLQPVGPPACYCLTGWGPAPNKRGFTQKVADMKSIDMCRTGGGPLSWSPSPITGLHPQSGNH